MRAASAAGLPPPWLRQREHRGQGIQPLRRLTGTASLLLIFLSTALLAPWSLVAASVQQKAFHAIISTDCSPYSDWQSEVLIYSHLKSKTAGGFTRIASCADPEYMYPQSWHPNFSLEKTPYFGDQTLPSGEVDKYPIYNKPMGIAHWLEHGGGAKLHPDTVVVLLDPDMIVSIPLERGFEDNSTGSSVVQPGKAAGQAWALGTTWYTKQGCEKMMREECARRPGTCHAADFGEDAIQKYYLVGAPYAMTVADWKALCPLWGTYLLRMRQGNKGWMQDMNAYMVAAMHLGLRHASTSSLEIWSTALATQAWHLLPHLDPRRNGAPVLRATGRDTFVPHFVPDGKTVPILHYCVTHDLAPRDIGVRTRWSKYGFGRAPAGKADCSPMPSYPYDNDKVWAIERNRTETSETRRDAFMLRSVASAVWEAMANYRQTVCGGVEVTPPAVESRKLKGRRGSRSRSRDAIRGGGVHSREWRPLFGTKKSNAGKTKLPIRFLQMYP